MSRIGGVCSRGLRRQTTVQQMEMGCQLVMGAVGKHQSRNKDRDRSGLEGGLQMQSLCGAGAEGHSHVLWKAGAEFSGGSPGLQDCSVCGVENRVKVGRGAAPGCRAPG